MAGTTITRIQHYPVYITKASQLPVLVTTSGGIETTFASVNDIGVISSLTGTVTNLGTITASGSGSNGIYLAGGGTVVNGVDSALPGSTPISGDANGVVVGSHGAGAITNFATITGTNGDGITLAAGGVVTNGSTIDTLASISGGYVGVAASGAPATIANYATITGGRDGIFLVAGGGVTNGSATDITARISASSSWGVLVRGGLGTVANYATITGRYGVYLSGGNVTNGGATDTTASIVGSSSWGVEIGGGGPGTVSNFGTITGGSASVYLSGGSVENGSATDTAASIVGSGNWGVRINNAGTIANFATITGVSGDGIDLRDGGLATNGSTTDALASISGGSWGIVVYSAAGTITNYATITGRYGVYLGDGGSVTNFGTIRGNLGIDFAAGGTVTNAGTVIGTGGTAIQFGPGSDLLILDPGATFVGAVSGGGGPNTTLAFSKGHSIGTFTGLGSANFTGFQNVIVDKGASWSFTGANTVPLGVNMTIAGGGEVSLAAGARLTAAGANLHVNGTLAAAAGTSTLAGPVSGGGTIDLDAKARLVTTGRIATKAVDFLAGGHETLVLPHPERMTATVAGFGATDTIDLRNIIATSLTFASGGLTITGGSGTIATLKFSGSYTTKNFVLASDSAAGTNIVFSTAASAGSVHSLAHHGGHIRSEFMAWLDHHHV